MWSMKWPCGWGLAAAFVLSSLVNSIAFNTDRYILYSLSCVIIIFAYRRYVICVGITLNNMDHIVNIWMFIMLSLSAQNDSPFMVFMFGYLTPLWEWAHMQALDRRDMWNVVISVCAIAIFVVIRIVFLHDVVARISGNSYILGPVNSAYLYIWIYRISVFMLWRYVFIIVAQVGRKSPAWQWYRR